MCPETGVLATPCQPMKKLKSSFIKQEKGDKMKMEAHYHELTPITCPECKVQIQVTTVKVRADAMLLIKGICSVCSQEVRWSIPMLIACYMSYDRTRNG